ncbi:thioredoxin [Peptoniphilus duerdenii ATCC BAA-1640]|uniref:Thioredoxin n=1 Tax=Peptoniphilus duerdenii ATCC BAA-1640 TaxID=862517 RepID=E0NLD2_9FIRM|nr:thioredoxin family protein [Peptoniphilus duerdenii]EFM25408.1 thioredoxin [Peptoniphilus duerdenii ATCC BAA-1640]
MRLLISSSNYLYEYNEGKLNKIKKGSFWKKSGPNYVYKDTYHGKEKLEFKGNVIDFSEDYFIVKTRFFQMYKGVDLVRTFKFDVNSIQVLKENIYSRQGDMRFAPGNILIGSPEFVAIYDESLNPLYEVTALELGVNEIIDARMIAEGQKGAGHLRIIAKDNLTVLEINPITKIAYSTINFKTMGLIEGINDYAFNVKNRAQVLNVEDKVVLVLNDLGIILVYDEYYKFQEKIELLKTPIDFLTPCFDGVDEIEEDDYRQYIDMYGSRMEHENIRRMDKINKTGTSVLNMDDLQELTDGVIIYGSRDCVHCEGAIDMVSDAHKEFDFKSYYMDLSDEEMYRKEKDIKSYPTTVILKDGQEKHRFVGKLNYEDFLEKLEEE